VDEMRPKNQTDTPRESSEAGHDASHDSGVVCDTSQTPLL
jgi:hypothetical protein